MGNTDTEEEAMAIIQVGTRKGVFAYKKKGSGVWTMSNRQFVGDPVNLVMKDPRDGSLYAVLDLEHYGTKLRRSKDGGFTWEEIGVPEYPSELPLEKMPSPDPEDAGREYQPKLEKIWALAPGLVGQPGVLWCGTIPGGLFKSEDLGASWTLVHELWNKEERKVWMGGGQPYPAIHSICVDPKDGDDIVIGVSIGGAWRTRDGGKTWAPASMGMFAEYVGDPDLAKDPNVQDPHLIVQSPTNPSILWTQHHNGVYRSSDRGTSWSESEGLSPSSFGFVVCIHPYDANSVWLVPAEKDEMRVPVDGKVVVNRTVDGGDTWETITEGLPQDDAYDIVLRHAMNVDPTGQVLAFGSTTGSLWVSEDQGEEWSTLSHHLPPIYCVVLTQ